MGRSLSEAMPADRQTIIRELEHLKRDSTRIDPGAGFRQRLLRLEGRLQASIHKRQWRQAHRPRVTGIAELPITASRDEIIAAIGRHPVVIVAGETGSGKTTQIPKFCLEAGRGIGGPDRLHPAAADRRHHGGAADRRGTRRDDRPLGGLQDPLQDRTRADDLHQDHDRRDPAGRDPGRSAF